jgi:maltose O-acetyltransferase
MRTERQKMLAGELYDPFDPELVAAREHARLLCYTLNATRESEQSERRRILRNSLALAAIPLGCNLPSTVITAQISIWVTAYISTSTVPFSMCARSTLVTTRYLAQACRFLRRCIRSTQIYVEAEYGKPIEIGADVWVGGGALILAGVRIGFRTIIGAGSIVTRDIPAGVLAAVNPCRVIRDVLE